MSTALDVSAGRDESTALAPSVIDIFAGPGGWDTGLRLLGYLGDLLGVEWDGPACATARAAGHLRLQADVAAVDPALYAGMLLLIASPPCQAWSRAGKGLGLRDQARIWQHVADVVRAGEWVDYPRNLVAEDPDGETMPDGNTWWDPRSPLVLEVLRWVLLARPRNVACEQVPDVLPFWRELARILTGLGYSAVAFEASAEQYGVPQTRRRAFLIASLDRTVAPPVATHQRYRKGEPAQAGESDLFGAGVLPWVSMAEALGWTDGRALVGFPRRADTPSNGVADAQDDDDRVIEIDGQLYRARDLRPADQPAQAVTEKVRSWEVRGLRNGNQDNAALRAPDEPAGTMFFGERGNAVDWVLSQGERTKATERTLVEPAPTVLCSRPGNLMWHPTDGNLDDVAFHGAGRTGLAPPRRPDEPASTVTAAENACWTADRPATVQGDSRIWPPGHKVNDQDRKANAKRAEQYGDRKGTDAVRVSVAEAGILQSFPADYPWQGTKTQQYRQVGDAVPPLLAAAVLSAVIGARAEHLAQRVAA